MTKQAATTDSSIDGAASALDGGLCTRETLRGLANRLREAGKAGRGCRVSAEEARLLLSYNLPCTADDPDVMDGA